MNGKVVSIFICPAAGDAMQQVPEVQAIMAKGLEGDRYSEGAGSWNKGKPGNRQVTLINAKFFPRSGFGPAESRRNIITEDIELMDLIGIQFRIGAAIFRGVKYCTPCDRPEKLSGNGGSFREEFHDVGGLIAEVVESGVITQGCEIIRLQKP